jgi:hypothetical protein
MVKIIMSVIIQGVGWGLFYAGMTRAGGELALFFFGVWFIIAGFFLFLAGLKQYFTEDLLLELERIKAKIVVPTAPPVSGPEHLISDDKLKGTVTKK